jgi:hypothetical protein
VLVEFLGAVSRRAAARVLIAATAIGGPVGGCAIHPLPEDVTGVPTYLIVRQIRCETRKAVIDSALGALTSDRRVDPASRAIAEEFKEGGRPIQQFKPALFKGEIGSIIQLFYDTGVAYDFDLQMTEADNVDPEVDLAKPFGHSKYTWGVKGSFDRSRKNDRTFTITDTFSGLIALPKSYCENDDYNGIVPPNYIYPIAGKIGVEHLVQDFINLTLFGNLGLKGQAAGPPTLTDALTFTTTISNTLTPAITFTPVTRALAITTATVTGSASRTDVHIVTMALALPGTDQKLVGSVRSSIYTAALLTARKTSSGMANAAEAVNQSLTRKLFSPTITVAP